MMLSAQYDNESSHAKEWTKAHLRAGIVSIDCVERVVCDIETQYSDVDGIQDMCCKLKQLWFGKMKLMEALPLSTMIPSENCKLSQATREDDDFEMEDSQSLQKPNRIKQIMPSISNASEYPFLKPFQYMKNPAEILRPRSNEFYEDQLLIFPRDNNDQNELYKVNTLPFVRVNKDDISDYEMKRLLYSRKRKLLNETKTTSKVMTSQPLLLDVQPQSKPSIDDLYAKIDDDYEFDIQNFSPVDYQDIVDDIQTDLDLTIHERKHEDLISVPIPLGCKYNGNVKATILYDKNETYENKTIGIDK